MNKINLKKPFTNLGITVVDERGIPQLINKELMLHINSMNTENPLKNTSICLRIFENEDVELDDVDLDFLKKNIQSCKSAPDYLRTAALKEIDLQISEQKQVN